MLPLYLFHRDFTFVFLHGHAAFGFARRVPPRALQLFDFALASRPHELHDHAVIRRLDDGTLVEYLRLRLNLVLVAPEDLAIFDAVQIDLDSVGVLLRIRNAHGASPRDLFLGAQLRPFHYFEGPLSARLVFWLFRRRLRRRSPMDHLDSVELDDRVVMRRDVHCLRELRSPNTQLLHYLIAELAILNFPRTLCHHVLYGE